MDGAGRPDPSCCGLWPRWSSQALATVGMLAFQAGWNSIEASNLYILNDTLRTLPFYMSALTSQANVVAGAGMAAAAS